MSNPTLDSILDLARRITLAMIREEGQGPGYANPLNLRDAPWYALQQPSTAWPDGTPRRVYPGGQVVERIERYREGKSIGWFWLPDTEAEGVAGALHVVALHIAEGDSLARFIERFAPSSENGTAQYIANVALWAGIVDAYAPMLASIKPVAAS